MGIAPIAPFTTQQPGLDPRDALQRRLARFNRTRCLPSLPGADWVQDLEEHHHLALIEGRFIEAERRAVMPAACDVPEHPDDFLQWFEALLECGPGQHDPLFPWLANQASLNELRWFLAQEVAGEAGFDDLVAMTQVRMPTQPKLEMARNYWDEMGRGRDVRMHGPMLQQTSDELRLRPEVESTVWESLALANLMTGLAANRRYAYHAVGALGAVELTAPTRVSFVDKALRRVGADPRARAYFSLHARIDLVHSRDWNEHVIRPLVAAEPELRFAIAEGALMRLEAGARCFVRYRDHLVPDEGRASTRTTSEIRMQHDPHVASEPPARG